MSKDNSKRTLFLISCWILSLGIHFAVFHAPTRAFLAQSFENSKDESTPKRIRITFQKTKEKKQIVESHQGEKQKNDSKYLSESNRVVMRETRVERVGKFKDASRGVKNGAKRITRRRRKIKEISLADLGMVEQQIKQIEDQELVQAPEGIQNGRDQKVGLAQANDYLDDLPLGDMVKLNTQEYKYYGYYQRIKRQLEQFWGVAVEEKAKSLFKRGRRLPASQNRITSLRVTLDRLGKIKHIYVAGSSGVRELDEAAIESFNRAGPFPNPPKGLVKNGEAIIEWSLVVQS